MSSGYHQHDEYCDPDDCDEGYYSSDVSDVAWALAKTAYSCLVSTPRGVPESLYVWLGGITGGGTGVESECCDELVVSIDRIKPVPEGDIAADATYTSHNDCEGLGSALEVDIVLLRPCIPPQIKKGGRNPSTPRQMTANALGILDDARTLECCIRQCLSEEPLIDGICGGGDFILKATKITHDGHCARIVIPVVLEINTCCIGNWIPDCEVDNG